MRYVSNAEAVRGVAMVAREARPVVIMVRRSDVAERAVVCCVVAAGTKAVAGETARRHRRVDFIMVEAWLKAGEYYYGWLAGAGVIVHASSSWMLDVADCFSLDVGFGVSGFCHARVCMVGTKSDNSDELR